MNRGRWDRRRSTLTGEHVLGRYVRRSSSPVRPRPSPLLLGVAPRTDSVTTGTSGPLGTHNLRRTPHVVPSRNDRSWLESSKVQLPSQFVEGLSLGEPFDPSFLSSSCPSLCLCPDSCLPSSYPSLFRLVPPSSPPPRGSPPKRSPSCPHR